MVATSEKDLVTGYGMIHLQSMHCMLCEEVGKGDHLQPRYSSIQWNLYNVETLGTTKSVLITGVSSLFRATVICHSYVYENLRQ